MKVDKSTSTAWKSEIQIHLSRIIKLVQLAGAMKFSFPRLFISHPLVKNKAIRPPMAAGSLIESKT